MVLIFKYYERVIEPLKPNVDILANLKRRGSIDININFISVY